MNRFARYCVSILLLFLLYPHIVMSDQEAGETVLKRGQINEDLYIAGGRVDVHAEVEGDVIAAGGRVAIDSQVRGDVIAAGGSVTVHGNISDDVRLAGGEITINATVGDGAVAAGGNVLLAPAAIVGGDVMFTGGRVELAGHVKGDVRIGSGQVVISGQIDGNVELAGKSIIIKPGAVIRGKLTYRSPDPAEIDAQAQIDGSVSHIPTPLPGAAEIAGGLAAVGILLWLSLSVTGIVLYLLFPRLALSFAHSAAEEPWKAIGLGLAIFATTPLLVTILFATGLGWLLALLLLLIYAMLLLLGFLVGVLLLSDKLARRVRRKDEVSKFGNSLAIALTLLVVMIIGLIPLLGWLLVFLLLLLGAGSTALQIYRAAWGQG